MNERDRKITIMLSRAMANAVCGKPIRFQNDEWETLTNFAAEKAREAFRKVSKHETENRTENRTVVEAEFEVLE